MGTVINHDLRSVNGGTIYLVPQPDFANLHLPDLSIPDSTQAYDVGTKYEFNNKVYFYAYASGAVYSRMAAKITNDQDIMYRACPTTSVIYATEIYATTVSPDGPSGDGTFVKDYMKGGHVAVFVGSGDNDDFSRGIIASTAVTSAGTIKLTLDAPVPHEVTAATAIIEAMASQYADVTYNGHVEYPAVGVPSCSSAGSQWVWVQTWGACWIAPASSVGVGGATGLVFRQDGSLDIAYATVSDNVSSQHAGYCLSGLLAGTQSAPLIYLQIAR